MNRILLRSLILPSILLFVNTLFASCSITVLGDSLSTGVGVNINEAWPSILANEHPNIKSLSGASHTSQDAMNLWLKKGKRTDILIIAIGANDALRGLPQTELMKNLDTIITYHKELSCKASRILLLVPQLPSNYPDSYQKLYQDTYDMISQKYNIDQLTLTYSEAKSKKFLSSDQLHPNLQGHMYISAMINAWIKTTNLCKK